MLILREEGIISLFGPLFAMPRSTRNPNDFEAQQLERDMMIELQKGIVKTSLPTLLLSSGRTSLADKFYTALHCFFLVAGNNTP